MIAGLFHEGSGLGDQLFRYITTRTLAEKKGYDWMMQSLPYVEGTSNFKGDFFKNFVGASINNPTSYTFPSKEWREKDVRDANNNDIRSYDPEINFVEDNTIIDGSFEDDKYWRHNLENINKWLTVEPLEVPGTKAIIGFRGGEYYSDSDLGLPEKYYREAIAALFSGRGIQSAEVHTDDPSLAHQMFDKMGFEIVDNTPISHSKHANMAFNWRSARHAKYAIIPNSAFFILPRILKHHEDPTAVTIAPRWWARRNTKGPWRPAAYYKEFTYI